MSIMLSSWPAAARSGRGAFIPQADGPMRTRPAAIIALAAILLPILAGAGQAMGAADFWQASGENSWSNSLAWSTNAVPTSADYAYIINSGTAKVDSLPAACDYLYLDPGTLVLQGTGQFTAAYEYVGYSHAGLLTQTGGANTVNGPVPQLFLGFQSSSTGTYQLSGPGQLTAATEYVGCAGAGIFTQTSGTNSVTTALYLGYGAGCGTYQLSGTAQLTVSSSAFEYIGFSGTGTFTQIGGTHTVKNSLSWACNPDSAGTYQLSATGQLTAGDENVGWEYGFGDFTQTGGTNTVNGCLYVGYNSGASGVYQLSGTGQLTAGSLYVGYSGTGTFSVMAPTPGISIAGVLSFGQKGYFAAVPDSAIHFTGSSLSILSTNSTNLAGLANLNLICEGGPAVTACIEAAGKDLGAVAAGWTDNFVLGTLTLGGTAAGRIKLVNSTTNQPGFGGAEALYVNNLVMNPGAAVNFNSLNLYYLNGGSPKRLYAGDANCDGIVDMKDYAIWFTNFNSTAGVGWTGGDFDGNGIVDMQDYVTWFTNFNMGTAGGDSIPEPATLSLLAFGLPMVRRRRR